MNKLIISIFLMVSVFYLNAVELVISYSDGTSAIRYYDDLTTELYFNKSPNDRYMISISGLEKFNNLQKIRFAMTGFLHDFSFLTGLATVEELWFQDVGIDNIDFLYEMRSLKNLIFQGCTIDKKIDDKKIEISRIPELEYFEYSYGSLTEFPLILNNKSRLKVINLLFNKISNISLETDTDIIIIVIGNPIRERKKYMVFGNFEDFSKILPPEYRKYIR